MTLDNAIVLHFPGRLYARLSDIVQIKHGYLEF